MVENNHKERSDRSHRLSLRKGWMTKSIAKQHACRDQWNYSHHLCKKFITLMKSIGIWSKNLLCFFFFKQQRFCWGMIDNVKCWTYSKMNLEISIHPWNYHHYQGHRHMHCFPKFLLSLLLSCLFVCVCLWDKNTQFFHLYDALFGKHGEDRQLTSGSRAILTRFIFAQNYSLQVT